MRDDVGGDDDYGDTRRNGMLHPADDLDDRFCWAVPATWSTGQMVLHHILPVPPVLDVEYHNLSRLSSFLFVLASADDQDAGGDGVGTYLENLQ